MFLGLLFNLSIWKYFKNGLDICHGPNGPVYGPNDVLVQVLLEKRKISKMDNIRSLSIFQAFREFVFF